MNYEETLKLCSGECEQCGYSRIVKGTEERIDREPRYYCALFENPDGTPKHKTKGE